MRDQKRMRRVDSKNSDILHPDTHQHHDDMAGVFLHTLKHIEKASNKLDESDPDKVVPSVMDKLLIDVVKHYKRHHAERVEYVDKFGHKVLYRGHGASLAKSLTNGVVIEFIDDRPVEDLPFGIACDLLELSKTRRICYYEYIEEDAGKMIIKGTWMQTALPRMIRYIGLESYVLTTITHPRTTKENIAWKVKKGLTLPSYFTLCRLEFESMLEVCFFRH